MLKERIKSRLVEFIKYDYQWAKFPFAWLSMLRAWLFLATKQYGRAFDTVSSTFCTGWSGSFSPAVTMVKKYYGDGSDNSARKSIYHECIDSIIPLGNTKKFFKEPEKLFEGMLIILKAHSDNEKGILLIKYSYYFALFAKLFNWNIVAEKYHIVLEPSWAGFCDKGILIYTELPHKVYVMTFEDRDKRFLQAISTNLTPVDIGPSWWIDHRLFKSPDKVIRDIDVLMIASWSDFKRHHQFFKALAKLKKQGYKYTVALAGYPGQWILDDIKSMAKYHSVFDQISFYECIPSNEVSNLMCRSKVNVLWSRFEGNNRSIIEGMFCDTPCILREGHNYGQHYDYINSQTGIFSTEGDFPKNLKYMIKNHKNFSPREYVLNHRSCEAATDILNRALKTEVISGGGRWTRDAVIKVNALHGMSYHDSEDYKRFYHDYEFLASQVREQYKPD